VYSDQREKYLGYTEVCIGLGQMAGPIIGSFIYGLTNFMYTFIVFAIFIFFVMVLVSMLLPAVLD
jgi:MFS family permease